MWLQQLHMDIHIVLQILIFFESTYGYFHVDTFNLQALRNMTYSRHIHIVIHMVECKRKGLKGQNHSFSGSIVGSTNG